MGSNKLLDSELCGVPVPDFAPEIYVRFPFL